MALERKTLREILEDETTDTSGKLKKILDVLHEETDTLQNQLDEKNAALAKAEKDWDAANGGKQADYFESERKITVYNARTDKVIMEAEGYMSISNNSDNELVCTVKIGPNTYRKNYIYLNDYTMYVVEDITGTHTDPYHYKLYFHTDILPSVETRP